MKKVAIIVHGLSGGGAERVASLLANYMVAHQIQILVVCAYNRMEDDNKARYPLDSRVQTQYIPIHTAISPLRFMERSLRIRRAVLDFAPSQVISLISYEAVLTAFSGVPFIFSLRNDPYTYMSRGIRSKLLMVMLSKARKIVFQSQGARNYFQQDIRQKSVVIPNPINSKALPLWTDCGHDKTFVTACRLNAQKNLPMLLDAFAAVHRKHPDYTLEIYGKGDLQPALEEQIRQLHAESYILLKGFSTDIHSRMAHASGFVLSSDYEGLSNSMLEALCIGVPCVCTDCPPGSPREYITSGENGFLTKVGDAADMEQKICTVIENPDLAAGFAARNLSIRNRLDTEVICAEWAKLLD